MTEKIPLRKLRDAIVTQRKIQEEIEKEVKTIFNELECDGLDRIEFWEYDVWIHLKEGCSITTNLFSTLNGYFHTNGYLSYSDGDGFIIAFKF